MAEREVVDVDQNSPEWYAARAGCVTASRFKDVLAKGQGKMRAAYLYQVAGEILTGKPMQTCKNAAMERGHEWEDEARNLYAFMKDVETQEVGFVRMGRVGCSPDSLIDDDGMLEIKTKAPHLMVEIIDKDKTPPEHMAQLQGQLWIADREWVDLALYCQGFPLVVRRIHRDEEHITEIREGVDAFLADLDRVVARVQAYSEAA